MGWKSQLPSLSCLSSWTERTERPGCPLQKLSCAPAAPTPLLLEARGIPSHASLVSLFATSTAGFLVFKPELISRLEQGQEPWVLDLQGAEGREAPRIPQTGEAWLCGTDPVPSEG